MDLFNQIFPTFTSEEYNNASFRMVIVKKQSKQVFS